MSLIILDHPYSYQLSKGFFFSLSGMSFFKSFFLVFIECGVCEVLKNMSYDWFLIRKGCIGQTYFFLFKGF